MLWIHFEATKFAAYIFPIEQSSSNIFCQQGSSPLCSSIACEISFPPSNANFKFPVTEWKDKRSRSFVGRMPYPSATPTDLKKRYAMKSRAVIMIISKWWTYETAIQLLRKCFFSVLSLCIDQLHSVQVSAMSSCQQFNTSIWRESGKPNATNVNKIANCEPNCIRDPETENGIFE